MFRLRLNSPFDAETLRARWDDRTSVARFAGNDGDLDNVFVGRRKDDRVRLVRKARNAIDPFATVFRGRIRKEGNGSVLTGFFGKSVLDYVVLALLLGFDVFLFVRALLNGTLNGGFAAGCAVFLVLLAVLAFPMKSARERYTEFLTDICGTEPDPSDGKDE